MLKILGRALVIPALMLVGSPFVGHTAHTTPPTVPPVKTHTAAQTVEPFANIQTGLARALKLQADQARKHLLLVIAWYEAHKPPPTIPYSYNLWLGVHNCEQPDTWHAGGHFGNGLAAGGNGLGFSADAWQIAIHYAARRGVNLPSSGWAASVDQQMQAAQAMLDATGGGPDCLGR